MPDITIARTFIPSRLRAVSTRMITRFDSAVFRVKSYILYFIYTRCFVTSFDQSVAFIIPALVALLHLKSKGIDVRTPFETNPSTMKLAVVATLLYYFTYGLQFRSFFRQLPPRFLIITHHCMVCFGNFSAASLGSIFFDDSARPILYLLCVLLSASDGLYRVYQRFAEEIEKVLHVRRPRYTCRFLISLRRLVVQRPPTLPW